MYHHLSYYSAKSSNAFAHVDEQKRESKRKWFIFTITWNSNL